MKLLLLLFFLLTFVLADRGYLEKLVKIEQPHTSDEILQKIHLDADQEDNLTRFFVVGDFGDLTKSNDLHRVTDSMSYLGSQEKFDFIATVGDNIYENGIASMDKLEDANLIMKAFKKPNIANLPMYVTLGNHDCYSDFNNEVRYREFDKQWQMDSDYYIKKIPLKDNPQKYLALLMSNSCLLSCMVSFKEMNKDDCLLMNIEVGGELVKNHYIWMEENLRILSEDPNAVWTGIVMHHSLLVVPSMKQELLPILRKYKIDMAIVGHNHMFEYSNIGYSEQIRFPGKKHGPVIIDCKDRKEIMNTPTRYQEFKKGEQLHQFMVGGSAKEFDDICPYYEQDGKVYFQNIEDHGTYPYNYII